MAQFGIRDADSALSDVVETMEPRSGIASINSGSVLNISLRNAETPQILEQGEFDGQNNRYASTSPPPGVVEMSAVPYDDSLVGSTIGPGSTKDENTPTSPKAGSRYELPDINIASFSDDTNATNTMMSYLTAPTGGTFTTSSFMDYEPSSTSPPRVGPKPNTQFSSPAIEPLPAVEGREGDLWSLPSQQRPASGLKVQNASTDDEDDWPQEAIMHMNLAGHSRDHSRS
jgi:hypothetical protein